MQYSGRADIACDYSSTSALRAQQAYVYAMQSVNSPSLARSAAHNILREHSSDDVSYCR
jgi:hypothetical protein